MIASKTSPRIFILKSALVAWGLALALSGFPQALASEIASLRPVDDTAPSLPLVATFDKSDGDSGPYILSLKNTSDSQLKVSARILLSVYFHADSKSRNIPEHSIDPGQVWTIPGLAANDKVTITAAGFAPLELAVP